MRRWQEAMPERDRLVYEKSGFDIRRQFGHKPALLIVDVTLGFIGRKPADVFDSIEEFSTSCGEAGWTALPYIKQLLDACREKNIPIVYTRGSTKDKPYVGTATKRHPGSAAPPVPEPESSDRDEIAEWIAPRPGEWVLEKPRASAFFATPLAVYLHQQGVDCLLVTGVSTSGCVRATVVDGHSHGFPVFVVEECTFDRAETSHLVSLYEMNAKYADVITLAEALENVRCLGG